MFLVSTRCGLIACRYLVQCFYNESYVAAPDIAEKYNMNVRALMPALRQLTRAGILRSRTGGKEPGFIFSRNPDSISLLEVLVALEGEAEMRCCKDVIPSLKCDCESNVECSIFSLFDGMLEQVKKKLGQISIKDHAHSKNLNRADIM